MTTRKTNGNHRWLSALAVLRGYLCLLLALALTPAPLALAADDELPPLIQATAEGDHDEVKRLLSAGADVNVADEDGWTSLDWAVLYDYPTVIDILADNGANVNGQDDDGWTALHFAAELGRPASARALIKGGANVNLGDTDESTPLHIAAQNDSWVVAEILVDNRADLNRKDGYGDTPLHDAAWFGSDDIADWLIGKGANIGAENNDGKTPLLYAQSQGHNLIADALIAANDKLDTAQKPRRESVPEQVYEKVWRSVVAIYDSYDDIIGSGVIVRPEVVATNCHVVDDGGAAYVGQAEDRRINEKGGKHELEVLYESKERDLCILSVEGLEAPEELVKVRPYNTLRIGEDVYAIGNPRGLDLSLSAGIISQLREDGQRHIQTDAAISGGSSGGGLFDKDGNLVGITTESEVGGIDPQNLNFAIPADWILGYFTETE